MIIAVRISLSRPSAARSMVDWIKCKFIVVREADNIGTLPHDLVVHKPDPRLWTQEDQEIEGKRQRYGGGGDGRALSGCGPDGGGGKANSRIRKQSCFGNGDMVVISVILKKGRISTSLSPPVSTTNWYMNRHDGG